MLGEICSTLPRQRCRRLTASLVVAFGARPRAPEGSADDGEVVERDVACHSTRLRRRLAENKTTPVRSVDAVICVANKKGE